MPPHFSVVAVARGDAELLEVLSRSSAHAPFSMFAISCMIILTLRERQKHWGSNHHQV